MRLRNLISGMAFAAFLLLGAGAANATSYDCDGGMNPVPASPPGDVDISETTACTISAGINAPGHINISATKVTVGAAGLVATNAVSVTGTSGAFSNSGPTTGSTVTVNAVGTTAKAITATAGAVNVDTNNAGVLKITGTITAAGPVTIGGTTTTAAAITATGGDITATATSGALSFTGTLTTQTSGRITLMAPTITAKIVTATGGDITATATAGALSFTGTLTTHTSGGITLMAPSITTKAISSASGLNAQASSSTISTGNITLNTAGGGSNTLLFAQTNLTAGTITEQGTASYLDIKVNRGGANSLFTVGATGTNGVGNISVHQGLFITNGTANSTGGVTFTGTTPVKFNVTGPDYFAAYFLVQANLGTITLPATINGNGASGHGGGTMFLSAATIDASNGSTITANQNAGVAGGSNSHVIVLAASNVTVGGTGLNLQANGDGGGIYQAPTGSVTYTDSEDIHSLSWGHSFNQSFAGSLVVAGSGAPLSETANGANGIVQLTGSSISLTNSSVLLQSNGAGGQQVSLYTGGALSFNVTGTTTLDASGNGGAGGTINIYAQPMTVAGTSFKLNANAGSGGNYNGGNITLYAASLNFDSTNLGTIGTVTANASGTGNAVYGDPTTNAPIAINFNPGAVTTNGASGLNLGTGADQFSFSANGGSSGGNAGTVKVSPNAPISVLTAGALNASALGGNGNGGWLYVGGTISGTDANFVNNSLTAVGFGSGNGGQVTAFHTLIQLDVNKKIKVDGGVSAVSTQGGTIQLNNITCHQFLTAYLPWPTGYWDCANNNPTAADKEPAIFAHSKMTGVLSTLKNANTYIYVFHDYTGIGAFFNADAGDNLTSGTFQADPDPTVGYIYVSMLEQDASGTAFTINQLDEYTGHELGHALDAALGDQSAFGTTYDTAWAKRDFLYLDYTDAAGTQPRDACVNYVSPGGTLYLAPFGDNATICPGGALSSNYKTGGVAWHNSKIAMQSSLTVYMSYVFTQQHNAWGELYANAVALDAYDDSAPPTTWNYYLSDKVIDNGFFGCTKAWGAAVHTGSTTPPPSPPAGLSCGVNVRVDYVPGQ